LKTAEADRQIRPESERVNMSSIQLIRQFEFNQMTLARLLADVSNEESLRQVEPANCINWIVGHLLGARVKLLGILGNDLDWRKDLADIYGGQSAGTFSRETAKPLSDLKLLLDQSLQALAETLSKSELALKAPCDQLPHVDEGGTAADRVGSYACHEAYHAGQVGLLRRFLGKPGLF
jgi:hypothetical protein